MTDKPKRGAPKGNKNRKVAKPRTITLGIRIDAETAQMMDQLAAQMGKKRNAAAYQLLVGALEQKHEAK